MRSAFLADSLLVDVGFFDCYKFRSEETEDSMFGLCNMAVTMHFLAIDWLPFDLVVGWVLHLMVECGRNGS